MRREPARCLLPPERCDDKSQHHESKEYGRENSEDPVHVLSEFLYLGSESPLGPGTPVRQNQSLHNQP